MEFCEKLQQLRKQKGLTQEELAEILYVSRTAVSKWESGRGYPNIDSLKAIANFFSVTIDELLSGKEMLALAEADNRQKERRLRGLVFGLLDCSVAVFFFLPLFGQKSEEIIRGVSLLSLTGLAPYLKISYFALVIGIILWGVLSLALQNWQQRFWKSTKEKISLILNAIGAFVFMISLQPYAAAFLFIYLAIKVCMLLKRG